jgi:hypothetical protein
LLGLFIEYFLSTLQKSSSEDLIRAEGVKIHEGLGEAEARTAGRSATPYFRLGSYEMDGDLETDRLAFSGQDAQSDRGRSRCRTNDLGDILDAGGDISGIL